MKYFSCLFILFLFFACDPSEQKSTVTASDRFELLPEPDKAEREAYEKMMKEQAAKVPTRNCAATDFMLFRGKELSTDFFIELESMLKTQYPNGNPEPEIFVDLTPNLLLQFINDIDVAYLEKNNTFEKDYHFDITPLDFKDDRKCKDKILLTFIEEPCSFRIDIFNSFLDGEGGCTESVVVYSFGLVGGRMDEFYRNAAG